MGLPFWSTRTEGFEGQVYARNPWNNVFLGGMRLPGICSIKASPTIEVDRQKVNGRDGSTLVLRGYLPGSVDIECKIWTPDQWQAFQDLAPRIWTRPGKLSTKGTEKASASVLAEGAAAAEQAALDLSQPGSLLWSLRSVVVVGVSLPEDGPEPGTKVIRIRCIEYVPTSKKTTTRKAKGSSTTVPLAPELAPPTNSPRGKKPSDADTAPIPRGSPPEAEG